ncbi:glycosyltransferase [Phycicoccus sp. CSK15P-2]|uniref:glycosyltransferase family 2 protein n=1 Tax=Phycicoccus sp. CSK15P-2 TaxID=2807627 RepID=UPI001951A267|nr:glycosyltransferase family 2 protein [Phycicoccus sp. CSK15P-2]MBM6405515.1 glycosyltransferase [Phycicoccus sp. CSK15P-2]
MSFGTPYFAYSIGMLALLTGLLVNHLVYAAKLTNFALCFAFMWCHLALKAAASLAARRHVPDPDVDLALLRVDVVVPVYNEDPELLAAGLRSIAAQDRLPRAVWVVDDGSTRDGAPFEVLRTEPVREALAALRVHGISVHEHRQPNAGKRHAQSVAYGRSDADVFVTVDSDTVLRHDAIDKILVPFCRPDVMSVAGTAVGQNHARSLFTRVIEIGFVMSFVHGRMAEGAFGSVRVNCGILAAYRGEVPRRNLDRFLGQRFLSRPVRAGDDRIMTLFAKELGRCEYQPEAVAYSALPSRMSHLVRQRLRWCRSFCWGTLWLLRRPVTSADFWFTATQVLALVMYGISMSVAVLGVASGALSASLLTSTVITAAGISLASHFRYVLLARRDEPLSQRLLVWWISPLASVLSLFVLLPLYFVAVASPRPQRTWGTRKRVEVGLFPAGSGLELPAGSALEPAVAAKEATS